MEQTFNILITQSSVIFIYEQKKCIHFKILRIIFFSIPTLKLSGFRDSVCDEILRHKAKTKNFNRGIASIISVRVIANVDSYR